jgi:hypothetical protein
MTNTDKSICAKIKIHEFRNKVGNSRLSTYSIYLFVGGRFYEDQLKTYARNCFISDIQKQRRSFIQAKYQEQKRHFAKILLFY